MRLPHITPLFGVILLGSSIEAACTGASEAAAGNYTTTRRVRPTGAMRYAGMNSSSSSGTASTTTSPAGPASTSTKGKPGSTTSSKSTAVPSATPKKSNSLPMYWTGANSYYLHTFPKSDRLTILDAFRAAGMSTVRIFLTDIYANNKGSPNIGMPDLEPRKLGVYDDTTLLAVDQLMVECKSRGLKLVIALHDRYALGFWSTDVYATTFGIARPGSSGAQMISDASAFYNSNEAMAFFDARVRHVMRHKNKLTGLNWSDSQDYIYAFEPENEPQGHMTMAYVNWNCDRASTIRSELPSGSTILVSTGGGITTDSSLAPWAFNCPYFDIISVHDYGTDAWTTANALTAAQKKTDKIVIMGEWGMLGENKANTVQQFVSAFKQSNLPWMYWQVSNPGKGSGDFEVWTNEPTWGALSDSGAGGINPGASWRTKARVALAKASSTSSASLAPSASPKAVPVLPSFIGISLPARRGVSSNATRSGASGESLFVPAPNVIIPSTQLLKSHNRQKRWRTQDARRFVKQGRRFAVTA